MKMSYHVKIKDGSKKLVEEFRTKTIERDEIELTVMEGDNFVIVRVPGYHRIYHVYKIEKYEGFKLFHEACIHTTNKFEKLLAKAANKYLC